MIFYKKPKYMAFYNDGLMITAAMLWGEKDGAYIVEYLDYIGMLAYASSTLRPSEDRGKVKASELSLLEHRELEDISECRIYEAFEPLLREFVKNEIER